MRRRLDLAASLVGRPAVIFLDEPSTGLDPASRQTMWQVIEGLAADGVTGLPDHRSTWRKPTGWPAVSPC